VPLPAVEKPVRFRQDLVLNRLNIWSYMKVLTFIPQCSLQRQVANALSAPPFIVEAVVSAKECLQFSQLSRYEAVLVDADSLSFGDVLGLVKLLRHENSHLSLFVFESRVDLQERLDLFDAGVDDCVRKPFFDSELAMRIGLSIRLRQAASNLAATSSSVNVLHSGDLKMDLMQRKVTRQGKVIDLRPKEFLLLEYLIRNVNRTVTRTMILEQVWQSSFEGLTNVVDVYINALRNKVDRGFAQKLIQTNRGIGYTFTCVPAQAAVPQETLARQHMLA
jgi:two-component system OmpR family response regulator